MPLTRFPQYNYDLGFLGKPVYINLGYNEYVGTYQEITFNNTDSAATILPFGSAVQASTANVNCVDILQPGGTILGFAVATDSLEQDKKQVDRGLVEIGYEPDHAVTYVRKGTIYLLAEVNLTRADSLFIRTVAKATPLANEHVGYGLRNDADGVDGGVADALTSVELLRDTEAGCVAPIRVEYKLA